MKKSLPLYLKLGISLGPLLLLNIYVYGSIILGHPLYANGSGEAMGFGFAFVIANIVLLLFALIANFFLKTFPGAFLIAIVLAITAIFMYDSVVASYRPYSVHIPFLTAPWIS